MNKLQTKMYNKDIIKLKKIGSDKDPSVFFNNISKAKEEGNIKYYIPHSILLNFSENGKHGCKFNCKFCSIKNHPLMKNRLVSSNDEIDNFLKGFGGYKVYLSGGGDPLYNYSKNKDEVNRIIDHLHEKGYLVNMITREYENALLIKDKINQFNFSTDYKDFNLLNICKEIKTTSEVRISVVYDDKKSPDFYIDMYNYYKDYCDAFYIREDYSLNNFSQGNIMNTKELIKKVYSFKNKIVLFDSYNCDDPLYLLGGIELDGKTLFN